MQTDEGKLISRILDGHAEDYGYFLERFGPEVFRFVVRLVPTQEDAEELVQDAFVRAYQRLDTFLGHSSFATWICRIAYNITVSWLRHRRISYLRIDDQPQLTDTEVDQALNDETLISQLNDAIALLKPDEQTLLNLYYFDGRPLADIGYILHMEPNTIATRLHRIRRKLYIIIKHGNKH